MLTQSVLNHYKAYRKPYVPAKGLYGPIQAPAKACLSLAKQLAFVDHNWDKLESAGLVRIRFEPDDVSLDDLAGDTYNVELNADSVPGGERTILAQEKDFKRQVENDGVWGFIVERKCPRCGNWEHVDSCWGFVGDPNSPEMRQEYIWAQIEAIKAVQA